MSEFMLVAMDQVLNEAPRLRYMSGGQVQGSAGAESRLTDSPPAGLGSTPIAFITP